MSYKLTKKGFTIVPVLLMILILAIVGGTGYYVYHANKNTKETLDAATKSAQSTPKKTTKKKTTSAAVKYLTIKEWGVRAPYSGKLTLEYSVGANSKQPYMQFSSAELDAKDPQCKSSADYGGAITRYKSTDHVLTEDDSDTGQTSAEAVTTSKSLAYSHIGDYYYFYSQPQADCANPDKDDGSTQIQTENDVKQIAKDLQPVQ